MKKLLMIRVLFTISLVLLSNIAVGEVKERVLPDTAYPYIVTSEKAQNIKTKYLLLKEGQSSRVVEETMGKPDEIHNLYKKNIWLNKIEGFTYWYIIQRLTPKGSANDKNEVIVRVTFNNSAKVIGVDHWGF